MRAKKIAYTMVPVHDVERARRFYEATLGLERGAFHGDWTEYDLPEGGCLLLGPAKDDELRVALEIEDLDAAARALGVKIIETPVCRMAEIRDPEGNAIVLHQLKSKTAEGQ